MTALSKPRRTRKVEQKQVENDTDAVIRRSDRTRMRTRHKLIAAAQRVMARDGLDKATIAEIASEADVGFGSFYNHFASKEEIAAAVFEAQTENFAKALDMARARTTDPALLVSYVQRLIIRKARLDPVWGWFVVRAQGALPQMRKTFRDRATWTLRRGTTEGRFDIKSLDAAITVTLSGLIGAIRSVLEGEKTAATIEADFVELMLRMYGVQPTEARRLATQPLPRELLETVTPGWGAS